LTPAATGNPLLSMFDPEKPSSRRPSLIGRALRRVAVFLVAICIGIAGTLAWQSPVSDPAKQQLASWARQQGWQSTSKTLAPETEKAVEQPSPPSQGPVRELPPPRPAAGTPVVAGAPTHEVLQQLEVIGRDLAAVRQNLEQLARDQKQLAPDQGQTAADLKQFAARQEQIAADLRHELAARDEQTARVIADLQTAVQNMQNRTSTPPPGSAAPARKPARQP
jgi:hypothetical protein